MRQRDIETRSLAPRLMVFAASFALLTTLAACGRQPPPAAVPQPVTQKTFASPEAAGAALREAAKSPDPRAFREIFGPHGEDVLLSGDAVRDKDALQDFVSAYDQMHRWREIKAGGEMLYVGADNFLFPIPLGEKSHGQWQFDTEAGKDEILARRIGRDELSAVAACAAVARAQAQYFAQTHDGDPVHQYAQVFVSSEGKRNGLYWPAAPGQPQSPLEELAALAKAAGYATAGGQPQPFDGYYFRILAKQGEHATGGSKDYLLNGKMTGGFAVLAYPVEYRNSGIMTFIVGVDGVVYQKDLGENTASLAGALRDYDPAEGWTPAI
jgi:hypothetical protein